MKKTLARIATVAGLVACSGPLMAASVVVTPGDVGSTPALNQWFLNNYRDTSTGFSSTTQAAITAAQPRNGNGSVSMSATDGTGKADYSFLWGFSSGRTLGALSGLSYDWYRAASSTNPAAQQPALRIYYDADGDASTTADQGALVWEQVYNGPGGANDGEVLTDQWVSSNLIGGEFWQRQFSPGNTIENFDTTLAEWMSAMAPAGADVLTANSAVLGIEFGIGSGWNGQFQGFVDNVSFAFGNDSMSFNFELAENNVPEPASWGLAGISLLALAAARRRKAR